MGETQSLRDALAAPAARVGNRPKMTEAEYQEAVRRQFSRLPDVVCPDCPVCGGYGWVKNTDGLVVPCPKIDLANLPGFSDYTGVTADEVARANLNGLLPMNGMKHLVNLTRSIMERGWGWIFIHGSYGVGKTELLLTATCVAIKARWPAAYVRMPALLDHLREAFDPETQKSSSGKLGFWQDRKLLAIDELDKVRNTPWAGERQFELLDTRYESATRARKTITLMASNEPPEELPGWLADRVLDGRNAVVKLDGKSVRRVLRA